MPDHTHPTGAHTHNIPAQPTGTATTAATGTGTNVVLRGDFNGHAHGGNTGAISAGATTGNVSGTNPPISNIPAYFGIKFLLKL
jgi:hypothetical protein